MKIEEAINFGAHPSILEKLGVSFSAFTVAQEEAIKSGLCQGKSLVIAAPTSSGKTTIAEIAVINGALNGQKSIYLVTHKALAEEKYHSFKTNYNTEANRWFEVSIATGDRTEGDWNDGILIATYEKYLALLSSSSTYSVKGRTVVADEIQILSDVSRGPDIEVLLSIIKAQQPSQFIALSATAPNVEELAGWLNCECLNITQRDVPLRQEVWYGNRRFYAYHGDEEIIEDSQSSIVSENTLDAVYNLLKIGLGPVLVFTMTRPRATELAEHFSQRMQQDTKSHTIVEQLDLFSEPTRMSDLLKQTSERKVAFHSADLSFSERSVVEEALRNRNLDVVFSTPTLAAGVNFPIRAVVFDSFNRFWMPIPWIPKAEYVNMSGRAGRHGLDDEGTAILIARSHVELIQAREYLSPELDPLQSKLFSKNVRKSVLHLVASRICKSEEELNNFYSKTFWWSQTLEHNPKKLSQAASKISSSIQWHAQNGLVASKNNEIYPTPLGIAISSSGLLPSTGIFLLSLLQENKPDFSKDDHLLAAIHAICASDEFHETHGQRFLPFAKGNQPEHIAWQELQNADLFIDPITVENVSRVTNAAYGIYQWSKGVSESKLRRLLSPISYGQFHTLASDISWVFEGLSRIVAVFETGFDSNLLMNLRIMADRVRYGVPQEALDILKAARVANVPGFGRQRAMTLLDNGLSDPNAIVNAGIEELKEAVQSMDRAQALIEAVTTYFSMNFSFWKNRHIHRAKNLGNDEELIKTAYEAVGYDYEEVVLSILKLFGWKVEKYDTERRQGVPDLLLIENNKSVMIECKTKRSNEATIDKDDAFEVLTKSVDINADHCVTIGKPDFDTFSLSKATGSKIITLIPHHALIEAFLKWREGNITSDQLFSWFVTPGVALIECLPSELTM